MLDHGSDRSATGPGENHRNAVSLATRNVIFTLLVPGAGAVYLPWWILDRKGDSPTPATWPAAAVIAAGTAGYLWCLHAFATAGRGTPGPWDPPRRVVASGPYRWVRNPIYLAALTVIVGEAWLFHSTALLLYGAAAAAFFHLIVLAYEEPVLRHRFGEPYRHYLRTTPRWLPRRPPR
jgi:protein-S-isoprenylcysteine O-methyltransferase Ste14